MPRCGCLLVIGAGLVLLVGPLVFAWGWYGSTGLEKNRSFLVRSGSSLTVVAQKLEQEGLVNSAQGFLLRAKIFASRDPVKAGEFLLPARSSSATILDTFQHGEVIRRFVTIPEGLPSVLVKQRLMAEPLLTGTIPVPKEGTVLPESYDFERGESRVEVLARMQQAMKDALAELWPKRAQSIAVKTPEEAIILASVVEKETGKRRERPMVAALYSNRLKKGMRLQADPTIIYPITHGKPLGRRIRRSEIDAVNGYNTYSMAGLPKGPITNPGRAAIEAVLHPASTDALYMVADGTGGHVFAKTLEEHNRNVAKWFAIRRARGER